MGAVQRSVTPTLDHGLRVVGEELLEKVGHETEDTPSRPHVCVLVHGQGRLSLMLVWKDDARVQI